MGTPEDIVYARERAAAVNEVAEARRRALNDAACQRIDQLLPLVPQLAAQANYEGALACHLVSQGNWLVGYRLCLDTSWCEDGCTSYVICGDGRLFIDNFNYSDPRSRSVLIYQSTSQLTDTLRYLEELVRTLSAGRAWHR